MAIGNIVDRRMNGYDVRCKAIFEPSAHDNPCRGATQFGFEGGQEFYFEVSKTTVSEAIETASQKPGPYTVYLYDPEEDK